MDSTEPHRPDLNFRRPVLFGLIAMLVLVGGGIAWSGMARISGAIIATGVVLVEGKPKSVQHLDGGIIRYINVSSGDLVEKGQILIELDDTSIRANLAIYEVRLRGAIAKQARLRAELKNKQSIDPPLKHINRLNLGDITTTIDQQQAILDARFSTLDAQLVGQNERIDQFRNQIEGLYGLIHEKSIQIAGYDEEISTTNVLFEKELAARSRLLALERARSDIKGQVAEHKAEISRVNNSISETKIAKLQIRREFNEQVISEIEKVQTRIEELTQQLLATRNQLSQINIKSPVDGMVHELNLNTIGGVVQPGQVLMQIIEQRDQFEFELNIDTVSIDQIFIGQKVVIRLPAFHQHSTPELDGYIKNISPTSVTDEKSGIAFYRALIALPREELARLEKKKLIPGMPIEGFIATEERTVLTYLIKPVTDNLVHVFREE